MMMRNTMTNNSGNMMFKITILLFAFVLVSTVPFASAQFVVGGGSSSGGSDNDMFAPLFIDNSITINQSVLVDGIGNESVQSVLVDGIGNESVVASVGDTVEFVVIASDNYGVDNITHIDIFLNHDGKRILNNLQETYISFKYGDLIIQNPQGLIESVTMDTSVVGDNKKFVFNVIFNETFDTSNVLVRAWDAYQHISMIYLFDSFKVVPAIISESTPITDESLDTEIIDIPVDISESVSDDAIISSEDIQNDMESVLPYSIMISGAKDVIPYDITGGAITGSIINLDNNSIVLNLSADDDGTLTISPSESTQSGIFMVLVDGEEANDAEIDGNTVTIPFLAGTETIEIIGTFVIPEFGTIAMMILLVSIVSIIAISAKSRLSIIPRY